MPRGDKTGPSGMGARTGRGLGYCSGSNQPGFLSGAPGQGMGRGGGRGAGRRPRGWFNNADYVAPVANTNNDKALTNKIDDLTGKLEALQKQIDKLTK